MKDCDILGSGVGGAKRTLTPLTYFQGVRTPQLPMIYAPAAMFGGSGQAKMTATCTSAMCERCEE